MEFCQFVLVAFLCTLVGIAQAQLKPIFINCGSNSSINVDGRTWIGDDISNDNFTFSSSGIIAATSTIDANSTYQPFYQTARFFSTPSHYNFSVFSGNHFIRLHFYPFSFENFTVDEFSFDITANCLKLASRFNVSAEMFRKSSRTNSNVTSLVKEYFLNVSSNELSVEFTPNFGSFAFVNAIELIPISCNLFVDSVRKVGGNGGRSSLELGDRGMETMYRLNVGGPRLKPSEDRSLWRGWESDDVFMFSTNAAATISNTSNISYASVNDSSIAPILVYETARIMTNNEVVEKRFNVSWRFYVDPNFDYLVRFHFCELYYDKPDQRIFRIYINNKTAANNYDVFQQAGGMNKAYHEDYLDTVQIDSLWVQLGPDSLTSASGTDALLNGLEVFKLSRNGNLAYVSERMNTSERDLGGRNRMNKILSEAVGAGLASMITISLMCVAAFYFWIRKKKTTPMQNTPPGWHPLLLHETMGSTKNTRVLKHSLSANGARGANRTGRRFSLVEIKSATKNFDESLVIGNGGFGNVYKGEIEDSNVVAIKRAHPQCDQGLAEFETEIMMLSKLRHRHLVSMIGYCEEEGEMILVYEYMANGSLRSHLYGGGLPALSWKQRLDACIGAARGLHYLHTGAERTIIHRDVKTTNILLDENFVAKMADFGVSKIGPALDHTHVSTAVKGSFGYLDPEYYRRQQLTQKSDVYSFGVVLFEVACARPVINPSLPKDQINLAEWALWWQRQRSLEAVVDPRLEGEYSMESLKKFGEIAEKCLADEARNRPTIGEVLWHLEYALQLHEAYTRSEDGNASLRTDLKFAEMCGSLTRIKEGEEEPCQVLDTAAGAIRFSRKYSTQGR